LRALRHGRTGDAAGRQGQYGVTRVQHEGIFLATGTRNKGERIRP
jgi:hypothetical protein